MQKRGICLDLDGTIIDSLYEGLKRLERVANKLGLPCTPVMLQKAYSLWGTPAVQIIQNIWPGVDYEKFHTEWSAIDSTELIPIFPGGFEALVKLSNKFYLSILTSRGRPSTDFQIYNYRYLFRFSITAQDVENHKPDPKSMDPVIECYNILGVPKENIIYIGDSVAADWQLAKSIDMTFYGVTTGVNSRLDFITNGLDETHVLKSIVDLPDKLG